MNSKLQRMLAAAGAIAAFFMIGWAHAAGYPDKPLHLVVPYGPGGTSDLLARITAEKLPPFINGQAVIVENRAGASGSMGTSFAARAKPDGYTLLQAYTPEISIVPALLRAPTYDPLKDLIAVVRVADYPLVLVANPNLPAKDLQAVIALAKQKPGEITYASSGTGSPAHLAFEMIQKSAGIKLTHVPYKGAGPALTDVLAGHVPLYFSSIAAALPYVRSGQLRALAVSSAKRAAAAPDIPTVAESGVPGFDLITWNGVFVPAGTPAAIVDTLNRDITKVFELPEVRERLGKEGAVFTPNTTQEFAAFVNAEVPKFTKVIEDVGIEKE
jgi:tripartite-type tricarboxylate transporter receptor subunit TctC